jgi:hypothetical protein
MLTVFSVEIYTILQAHTLFTANSAGIGIIELMSSTQKFLDPFSIRYMCAVDQQKEVALML